MNTADQEFMAKIGNGIDFISSEMIQKVFELDAQQEYLGNG